MPIQDVFSRLSELTAFASRVADPETARATAGVFADQLGLTSASQQVQADQLGLTAAWQQGLQGLGGESRAANAEYTGQPYTGQPYTGHTVYSPQPYGVTTASTYGSSQAGLQALTAATGEIGVQEEPPGSNDGARIAQYRAASGAEATPGRWCAYFVSWAAAQAGTPLGDQGQGFGAVSQIEEWGRRTGRLVPPGELPRPGDVILYGSDHVGIVESVGPGDRLTTVEGNHSDRVERVERSLGEATGFVRI